MEKDYFMNSWNGLNTNIIDQSFFNPSPSVSTSSLSNDAFALLAPHSHDNNPNKLNFPILDTDPGFAERAAKFSCFGSKSFNGRNQVGGAIEIPHGSAASPLKMLPRVSSTPSLKKKNFDSMGFPNKSSILSGGSRSGSGANSSNEEESTVSEQILSGEMNIVSRKRKQGSRVKTAKQDDGSHLLKEIGRGGDDEKTMKRTKNEKTEGEGDKEKATETEPLKDYIHVRARRGQATDNNQIMIYYVKEASKGALNYVKAKPNGESICSSM